MDNRYTTSLLYHFTVQLNDSCWLVLCLHCYVAHLLTHHTRELAANDLSVFGGSSVFTIELSDVVPSGPQTPAEWLQDTLCSNCLFCLHWCYHLYKKQTNKQNKLQNYEMAAASWGGKEALRKGTVEKPTLPNTIDLLEINYKSNYFYRHCLCLHAHQYSLY